MDHSKVLHPVTGSFPGVYQKAGFAVSQKLGHGAPVDRDDGRSAGERFHDAVAERLVEVNRMQQCLRISQQGAFSFRPDGADISDLIGEIGLNALVEIPLILDDSRDDQLFFDPSRDLDCILRPLVRMDTPEKKKIIAFFS